MKIPTEDYKRIEELISSDASPVGIDAKKTHIMILRKLELIEERLTLIEEEVGPSHAPDLGDEGTIRK